MRGEVEGVMRMLGSVGRGVMFLGERIAWEDKKPHHLTRVI